MLDAKTAEGKAKANAFIPTRQSVTVAKIGGYKGASKDSASDSSAMGMGAGVGAKA